MEDVFVGETEIKDELKKLKCEVDSLQIKVLSESKPWYEQVSIIIAFLALLFSFGTTVVSYQRTLEQDKMNFKQELRGLVLQLVQQPLKAVDLNERYKGQPLLIGSVSGSLVQESAILANQAAVITKKIPTLVTASEYLAIAVAFHGMGQIERAKAMRDNAIKVSDNALDIVIAFRQLAATAFQKKDIGTGREYFANALSLFTRFPIKYDLGVIAFTNSFTEMYWAQQEALANNCGEFEKHISEAKRFALQVHSGVKNNLLSQIKESELYGCPPNFR